MYTEDYYKILKIKFPSSQKEIHEAYVELAQKHHPDKGGDEEQMKLINRAYGTLSNEIDKSAYDKWYLFTILKVNIPDVNSSIKCKIWTLDKVIKEETINTSYFSFDYTKYICDDTLFFYEKREGSHIFTIVTSKDDWYRRVYNESENIHICVDTNYDKPKNKSTTSSTYKPKKNYLPYIVFAMFIGIIFLTVFLLSASNNNPSTVSNQSPAPTATTQPTPTPLPPEPLPENGYIFKYPEAEMIAPFTINTEETSENHYIYLKYQGADRTMDMSFFVRANSNIEVSVPLGTYEMFYCVGTDWYGTNLKFGANTSYYTADELFDFTYDDGYVYGHTITLYPVLDGNLETSEIEAQELPE